MPSRRLRVVWMAKRPRSQAIQRRLSFSATAAVVPEPQKQSSTRSPSLEDAFRILSIRASAFVSHSRLIRVLEDRLDVGPKSEEGPASHRGISQVAGIPLVCKHSSPLRVGSVPCFLATSPNRAPMGIPSRKSHSGRVRTPFRRIVERYCAFRVVKAISDSHYFFVTAC